FRPELISKRLRRTGVQPGPDGIRSSGNWPIPRPQLNRQAISRQGQTRRKAGTQSHGPRSGVAGLPKEKFRVVARFGGTDDHHLQTSASARADNRGAIARGTFDVLVRAHRIRPGSAYGKARPAYDSAFREGKALSAYDGALRERK